MRAMSCPVANPAPDVARRRLLLAAALATALPARAAGAEASISALLLDGSAWTTEQHRGRVLLVNFWATWCAPCLLEMPAIDAYHRQHRAQGFEVLALSADDPAELAKVREAARPYGFAVGFMKQARLSGFGRIWRLPVSAVIDREGRLVQRDWFAEPRLDAAALDAVIKPLL